MLGLSATYKYFLFNGSVDMRKGIFRLREVVQSQMGQNYVRGLFALGFQGFLIMVCVGIYAVLIQSIAFSSVRLGNEKLSNFMV